MTSQAIEALAPAKINLSLHVTGQRADGYHLLDSLVMFADLGDRISLTPASSTSLMVTGPMAAGVPDDARNLCWKAAQAFGAPRCDKAGKTLACCCRNWWWFLGCGGGAARIGTAL